MEERIQRLEALQDSLAKSAQEMMGLLGSLREQISASADRLRMEATKEVFTEFHEHIRSLDQLMAYIQELNRGLKVLADAGWDISPEPLACWQSAKPLFQEMLDSFERQDWVTFCDLVQYELKPLLVEGERGLEELSRTLKDAGP